MPPIKASVATPNKVAPSARSSPHQSGYLLSLLTISPSSNKGMVPSRTADRLLSARTHFQILVPTIPARSEYCQPILAIRRSDLSGYNEGHKVSATALGPLVTMSRGTLLFPHQILFLFPGRAALARDVTWRESTSSRPRIRSSTSTTKLQNEKGQAPRWRKYCCTTEWCPL